MKKRFYIGIDPGVNTGYALWDSKQGKFDMVSTITFWGAILLLEVAMIVKEQHCIVIEDPNLNRPTFDRPGQNTFVMKKIAQNVGSNKRDAQLLIEWCESNGFEVVRVKPSTAKWDKNTFIRITKWERTTNEHGRDAAKLIFGM